VDSEHQWVRARADYQKALAFYQWPIAACGTGPASVVPVSYRPTQEIIETVAFSCVLCQARWMTGLSMRNHQPVEQQDTLSSGF